MEGNSDGLFPKYSIAMPGLFRTFSLTSRPAGGILLLLIAVAVVLLPILLICSVLVVVFIAVRLILQAIMSMVPFGSRPVSPPFSDDEGRRNVRVRQIQDADSASKT